MSAGESDAALLQLLRWLSERQYRFITPTPLTHSRVLARPGRGTAWNLSDIFGWSLPFTAQLAGEELMALMRSAQVLVPANGEYRSAIRVSTLDGGLYIHSAYPTTASDAIFFGPDTYRFVRFLKEHLPAQFQTAALRCVDIGCGSGAGGIALAADMPASRWLMTDINPQALRMTAINARHADVAVETQISDVLLGTEGGFDLVVCNPPYLEDAQQRAYRHGGAGMGRELSLRIAREAFDRLKRGGCLMLYTGVAIVDGEDPLLAELGSLFDRPDCVWEYTEIDPDVFGEELAQRAYAQADRIAAVGLVVIRL